MYTQRRLVSAYSAFTLALACAVAASILAGKTFAAEKTLRAGAFAIDITPTKLPVPISGGILPRFTSNVNDPLHARCLVLDDGQAQIVIAIVDSLIVSRQQADKTKELASQATGIPTNRMLIAATHTHSAPAVMAAHATDPDEEYAEYMVAQIAKGIAHAQKNLRPARIGWAMGKDDKNVFCRRYLMKPGTAATNPFSGTVNDRAQMNPGHNNPNKIKRTGPADTDVAVLSVQALDGKPIALLSNYSTHYVGAPPISADYFAVFCEKIAEKIGAKNVSPAFVGMLSNGTSGDANCLDFDSPERRKFDRFSVAEDVASAAFEAYQTIEYYDWVPLVMDERVLTLGVRMPSEEEVAKAKAVVAELPDGLPRNTTESYARETVLLSQMPPTREMKLQAVRIGELGITALPYEAFGSTGLEIKKRSQLKPAFNIDLANGYFGYLPPPDQHKLGGYTTWRARTSMLEVEAEPKVVNTLLELLENVANQRADEKLRASMD
ncbi:MAG: hypothetical protein H8E44_15725 [Planctomycetes bacterium]|nr:hypothetical protein [Planctomycetota bacterium]MBL7044061.1 hypothetical protein [Pirellulaceae bacterium]